MQKKCPKCENQFECMRSTDCWCNDPNFEHVPLVGDVDCVCKDCLLWVQPIDDSCQKHHWIVGEVDIEDDVVLFECSVCHRLHELNGVFQD